MESTITLHEGRREYSSIGKSIQEDHKAFTNKHEQYGVFQASHRKPFPIRAAIDIGTGGMMSMCVARVDAAKLGILKVMYQTSLPLFLQSTSPLINDRFSKNRHLERQNNSSLCHDDGSTCKYDHYNSSKIQCNFEDVSEIINQKNYEMKRHALFEGKHTHQYNNSSNNNNSNSNWSNNISNENNFDCLEQSQKIISPTRTFREETYDDSNNEHLPPFTLSQETLVDIVNKFRVISAALKRFREESINECIALLSWPLCEASNAEQIAVYLTKEFKCKIYVLHKQFHVEWPYTDSVSCKEVEYDMLGSTSEHATGKVVDNEHLHEQVEENLKSSEHANRKNKLKELLLKRLKIKHADEEHARECDAVCNKASWEQKSKCNEEEHQCEQLNLHLEKQQEEQHEEEYRNNNNNNINNNYSKNNNNNECLIVRDRKGTLDHAANETIIDNNNDLHNHVNYCDCGKESNQTIKYKQCASKPVNALCVPVPYGKAAIHELAFLSHASLSTCVVPQRMLVIHEHPEYGVYLIGTNTSEETDIADLIDHTRESVSRNHEEHGSEQEKLCALQNKLHKMLKSNDHVNDGDSNIHLSRIDKERASMSGRNYYASSYIYKQERLVAGSPHLLAHYIGLDVPLVHKLCIVAIQRRSEELYRYPGSSPNPMMIHEYNTLVSLCTQIISSSLPEWVRRKSWLGGVITGTSQSNGILNCAARVSQQSHIALDHLHLHATQHFCQCTDALLESNFSCVNQLLPSVALVEGLMKALQTPRITYIPEMYPAAALLTQPSLWLYSQHQQFKQKPTKHSNRMMPKSLQSSGTAQRVFARPPSRTQRTASPDGWHLPNCSWDTMSFTNSMKGT